MLSLSNISYLSQSTRCHDHIVYHKDRDQECRGESETPPKCVTPPGILNCVVELKRTEFDQGENKRSLKVTVEKAGKKFDNTPPNHLYYIKAENLTSDFST